MNREQRERRGDGPLAGRGIGRRYLYSGVHLIALVLRGSNDRDRVRDTDLPAVEKRRLTAAGIQLCPLIVDLPQ